MKINEQLFRELLLKSIFGEGTLIYNEKEMTFVDGRTLEVYVLNKHTIEGSEDGSC